MRQRTAMQDELDENQNKTDEELKRLGFWFLNKSNRTLISYPLYR